MDRFNWVNPSEYSLKSGKKIIGTYNVYSPIEYTSYELTAGDKEYFENLDKRYQYSATRSNAISEVYRNLYESGDYKSEQSRRTVAEVLHYTFPEFSEDYFYNNAESFIKNATGVDANIETYSEHIKNVWNSAWLKTGTSLDLATLYIKGFLTGELDDSSFQKSKQIIMNRTRTNGQNYRAEDNEDMGIPFIGKMWSKVVEQSPNILPNIAVSLLTGGAAQGLSLFGKATQATINVLKRGRQIGNALYVGLSEMGSTALEMANYGFDDDVIFYTSILQGIFTGILETFLEDKVFSGFNNYLDSIAGLKAPDGSEIVDYSFKSAIRKYASSYGKEFVPELGEEATESISLDALYNIGVAIQNSRSKKSGNTSGLLQFKSPEEFANNAWESVAEAMWSAGFTSFGGAFMDVASDRNNYRAAKYSNVNDPNKDTTGYSKMAVRTSALSSFVDKNNVATESEINGTKANPVSLIRIGSKVFPEQKFDKYQNFAVQNGKYVFADVKTFDIIPKEEITNEDDGISIKASEADASLALMAKSNLISSYAYIDNKGNVSAENNGDAVRLAVKNENGTFYYNIENDLSNVNDKSSNTKKATNDSKAKTTVQDNPVSTEPIQDNQNTSNQKQDDKVSVPKQDGFNVVDALDDENNNDIIIAQNSISKLVAGNTGIITLKKMSENASKKNADGNGYYTDEVHYVGSKGKILDSAEDASYIAVKRSDKPSYDLIKIGSRNSADKIIKELKSASKKKSEVIDNKKDSNEKSLSTATVVKQENDVPVQVDNNDKQESADKSKTTEPKEDISKSNETEKEDNKTINKPDDSGEKADDKSKQEEPVIQTIEKETKNETKETENEQTDFKEEEKITKNDEKETELDKKDKDVSLKNDENTSDLKQDNKDIENNPPKSSEKLEETDIEGGKDIEKTEDSESTTVTSTEIENESLKNSGNTSEKQKKIVATVVDSGISGKPLDESGKAMDGKEIPSADKSKTPEAYVLNIGDLALSFDSVNTKTSLKTLFGTKYESIDNKSEKLFDLISKRLNGESTGSKARDVLVDKILALAKAEWIVDRQKNNIDSSTISRIDEFFGIESKDEKVESEEKTTPANKVKEIPTSVNGLDIKTAVESANKVISEAFYEFTSKTDNTVKRKSFLVPSEIQVLSEMLYLNGSTLKETIDSIFRKRVKIYSDLVIGKGKNKAITKSTIITASKNLIEAKAKMLSIADSDDVALKKKFATDYITKAVDASLIYYLSTLKDTDINYFIELKDNSGDPISSEMVLSNGKTNWNYAPLMIISNAKKYNDISNTKTASEVAESKAGQVDIKPEGITSEGTTAKENKAVETKEKKPLFVEIGGKHVFDSKELSRNIVETTGIDEETAEILSEVASSYSPSVQENIFQASKGTVFSSTAFESQTGSTVTGAFDVNEKTIKVTNDTDAPTVIHELGHFVWHTNPEVAENITSAFADCTDDSEIEQFRKYIDERLPLFKSLLGNYFENVTSDEIIDFIIDYTDVNVDYNDIVFHRDSSDNSDESIQHSKESIVFEEIVMAFMEAYHLDNQMIADTKSESSTSMPSRLVSALKKLGDIFRNAYEKVFGSSFNPDVEMNEVLRDAFNELYSEDGYSGEGNVYTETSGNGDIRNRNIVDNGLRFRSVNNLVDIGRKNSGYTYNEANIDYYTDYLASKLVSIDRSKGRTSTSYDESVKKFMPYRVNGIFRKADVDIIMDKMDKSGYFDDIKNDLTNLSDATLHEIKMQTVEKLIYSRQTPIQEGARLRKLANEFRKNAIDLTTGKFKTTGGNVLTVDDVRSLNNSDNKFDKKLYDSFIALESFFFGKNGWLSEIYRNSSNMSAIFKNKQTHLDKMKDRLFDDIRNAPEEFSNRFKSKLVNPTQEFKESFITSQNGTTIRNGISGDTRIDVLYYLMDTLVDEKGNPVAWVEAPSSNSVIRKDGGLYHGLLVDMMNYAMTDDNAKVFSKDPYSTIDVSYAKASSMMMSLYGKEINNMSNQDINVYLFNNSMNNLIEYISDVNELGKEVADNNVSALLNANTSEEFLDNYIDSMTSAIGSITMTNRTLSDLDKTISEGKAEVDEIISAFSDAAKLVKKLGDVDKLSKENVKLSKDIEAIRDRGNVTIDKLKKKITEQNETIKNQIKSISELTKKVDEGNVVLFNSQIKDMMESHRNEIHDLKEQISFLQEKLNSYSDENLYKIIDDYANINKKLEAAYKANKELRERLKFINDNITDNSLLDEATRTRNMLNEMRDYIKGKAKPEGNAFEAQMSIFYDTFNTRYDLGAKKIIDPNKVFSSSIIKSYEYIGASTDNIHKLCNRLLKFAYNSGMVSRVEGDRNHLEVTRTINSLDIQQISELMGILSEMESDAKKAFKEYSERKSLQEDSIYKAITDDLSAKSKNEMSLEEFSSNFKTGSEQTNARFQKNPLFKAFGMVETVAPKLREMSPALYSVIFGGYVNGKYNDMNLVEAYNNEMKFEEERFDRSFSEIADILNRYENTDKYTADYVATHLESLFSGKLDMGSLSIEEFESLHGNLSLIDGNGNIYMNSTNDDFVELARLVTEYKKEINRLNTKIMKSTERFEALVEYYNIDRNDIEHASENPEIKTSDLKFLESYSANIEVWTNKVEMLKQQLEQPNKEGFTYTINSAMDIYLIARQEGGIERLMKDVKVDNPSNNVKNNLTLGNILYVFDLFNSPEMKKYLDVMNVLQKELASRRFEIEAVRYRSHNKMLDLVESYYTYDVDDTKLGYLPNIGTPSTDSLDYLDNVLSVGNVNDGMTKGRENVKNQNLNLNAIGTFINQIKKQERYIAFYETMSFLNSLVKTDSSRDITTALMYAFGDKQGVLIKDEIVSMLKSIAHKNGNSGQATAIINGLRTTHVYKSLGFSIVSGIVQAPAYLLVVDDIGAKNAARYFSEYFRESSWFGIRNFGTDRVSIAEQLINEYAPQMKEFKTTMTMLPKDSFTGKLIRKIGKIFDVEDKGVELSEEFNAKFRRVPFKFIDFMNRNIAYATWYAYYKTYLNQNPNRMTDPEYIKYCANEATQKTMDITPSTLEKDRAVLYNESDTTIKQLLLFTHQNNKIFNKLMSKVYGKFYGEGNLKEIAKTLGVMALVSAVSAAFNGYAFAHDDEDDRGFVPNLVQKTTEYIIYEYLDIIIPVAGGMIKDFHEGYGFMSNTPIIGTASELYSVLTEKKKGKNWNQKAATAFANLTSEVLSAMELPGGIVNKVYRSFRDGTPLWLLNYNWAKVGM